MNTNTVAFAVSSEENQITHMMHEALDKMCLQVNHAGHKMNAVNDVRIIKRTNQASGLHVHASCSIKVRFDASVIQAD